MNSLSWMIYVAGMCDELRGIALLSMLLGAITTVALAIHWKWRIDFDGKQEEDTSKKLFFGAVKTALIVSSFMAVIVVFVPSKDTIYAIAASEVGEEVITSPEATKARAALNAWLDKQIGEKPEK